MSEQPERLDLRSHDIAGDKSAQLLELFPEARTEDGQIDFDQLRRALGETVDPGKERYGLTWPVADGALLVCLDGGLSLELMRAVAKQKPERFVVLDEGFAGNDQLKANAVQIFKAADVTFRTV